MQSRAEERAPRTPAVSNERAGCSGIFQNLDATNRTLIVRMKRGALWMKKSRFATRHWLLLLGVVLVLVLLLAIPPW